MRREHAVCALAQIPPGEGRSFDIGGHKVAIFRTRSCEVFALQANCPHRGGPLADGLVGGTTVVCPLHERAFDLRTGTGLGHEDSLKSYGVRVSPTNTIVVAID
jgi:nitrite reductase (NADH) small subunit